VYRKVIEKAHYADGVPSLTNLGYVCFVGADACPHHLVHWDGATDEEPEEWEVICGGCEGAVALPAVLPPREPHRAPRYAPLHFGCPGHDTGV
jgi:hypothetical protein